MHPMMTPVYDVEVASLQGIPIEFFLHEMALPLMEGAVLPALTDIASIDFANTVKKKKKAKSRPRKGNDVASVSTAKSAPVVPALKAEVAILPHRTDQKPEGLIAGFLEKLRTMTGKTATGQ